jgi:Flp pilus assembly protein TadG
MKRAIGPSWIGRRQRGAAIIYCTVVMVMMIAFVAFAVDIGRARLAKTELQRAADAASMYGVAGLAKNLSGSQIKQRCVDAADDNKCDGAAVVLNPSSDVEWGTWDPGVGSFTAVSDPSGATAIRITARRTYATGNPIPTTFARVLGRNSFDVKAISIAARGHVISPSVKANGSPWLAGMPAGSTVPATGGNPTAAKAPTDAPAAITDLPIVPGSHLSFRNTSGSTSYDGAGSFGPDGNTSWIVQQTAVNGINSTAAPLNALVGIFLDDRTPSTWSMNGSLDFSTTSSRNFTNLSPKLKQVFFIGDGLTDGGQLQDFVVPTGATRFYLGIMDEKGWWWDNTGTLSTTMMDAKVTLVK